MCKNPFDMIKLEGGKLLKMQRNRKFDHYSPIMAKGLLSLPIVLL